jgi:hypothetical protein
MNHTHLPELEFVHIFLYFQLNLSLDFLITTYLKQMW